MKSLREQAMDYLARREHSRQELLQKLRLKGHESEAILSVLEKLNQDNLQSDERFTEMFIYARQSAGFGPRRIAEELRSRGIEEALFSSHLKKLNWFEVLEKLWQKKFKSEMPKEAKSRGKQQRFFLNRGFSMNDIIRLYQGGDNFYEQQ